MTPSPWLVAVVDGEALIPSLDVQPTPQGLKSL
jgi:hypothetical protein